MLAPSLTRTKADLRKLFVIDDRGDYAGDYTLDEECTVEYRDFLNVLGDNSPEDFQSYNMGEHTATVMAGKDLTLIAISRGPLGSEELGWAKGTMVALESYYNNKKKAKYNRR